MQVFSLFRTLSLAALMTCGVCAYAAEPSLEIDIGGTQQLLTRTDLLAKPEAHAIDVSNDVAYHRNMHYQALPMSVLLHDMPANANVQFTATDGFVANIPAKLLLGAGQPWLAIETDGQAWPPLKAEGPTAGPFYLVWLTPEKGHVSQEQWPYQIGKISLVLPLESRYPQIQPESKSANVLRGLHVYTANCSSCHPINGGGDAAIGPDLALPHGPTEYFRRAYLRALVRDPASVRNWSQRVMPGFSTDVLSDSQLDDLLAYLKQMSKQRK
jgi:mono/diheme cytochrome c family protein